MQVNVKNTVEDMLADARNELQAGAHAIKAANASEKAEKPAGDGVADDKKVETKAEGDDKPATEDVADDLEDDSGITPRERRDYSAEMIRKIGRKHAKQLSAEAFATQQYNERQLAEQRARRAEQEVADLKARLMPAASDAPKEPEKPKREAFKTQEEFDDAMIEYRVDSRLRAREAEAAKAADIARMAEINRVAAERMDAARALVPDFDARFEGRPDPIVPPHIGIYMQESELIAELTLHFSDHPDELENLRKLTIGKSLVEIGKIAGRLQPFSERFKKPKGDEKGDEKASTPGDAGKTSSTLPSGADKKPSIQKPRAGAPIVPIAAGSAPQVEKASKDMTTADHISHFEKAHNVDFSRRRRH